MIPKIIHYAWFSNEEYPEKVKNCISSWRDKMPDYELSLWNMERISGIDVPYLQEAIAVKKWAFASDYVRLYALYNCGGIYLDTDVFVYKPFDNLLINNLFIGKESSFHLQGKDTCNYLSSHCFGAEKGHPYLKRSLEYYNSIHFILNENHEFQEELRFNMRILPYVQALIAMDFGYDWRCSVQYTQKLKDNITVYPSCYFDPKRQRPDSYCVHLALGSWRTRKSCTPRMNLKYKITWRIEAIVEKILNLFSYTMIKIT